MAGKRDEVFLLGEEEMRSDPWSGPEEQPTATVPVPGAARLSRLRPGWPLALLALAAVGAVAFLARSGGGPADPVPPTIEASPSAAEAPEVAPVTRAPHLAPRPHHAPRRPRRPRPGERRAAGKTEEPRPVPPAEGASAPSVTYTPMPEAASEAAPAAAAPAPAAPLPAERPEFGIER